MKGNGNNPYILCMGKGLVLAYIISLTIFIVFSILLTYTKIPEKVIPSVVVFTTIVSISMGSGYLSRRVEGKGWLHGGLLGLIYVLLILVLGNIFIPGFNAAGNLLTNLLIAFIIGAIGGIIGINL